MAFYLRNITGTGATDGREDSPFEGNTIKARKCISCKEIKS